MQRKVPDGGINRLVCFCCPAAAPVKCCQVAARDKCCQVAAPVKCCQIAAPVNRCQVAAPDNMGKSLSVLLLAASLTVTAASSCQPCPQHRRDQCDVQAIIRQCSYLGIQTHDCECCPVCKRRINDVCGGISKRECASFLECKIKADSVDYGSGKEGICRPSGFINVKILRK